MDIFRTSLKLLKDGSLSIHDLPFRKGERVEVIVQRQPDGNGKTDRYPLRGKLLKYDDPFSSIDADNWNVQG